MTWTAISMSLSRTTVITFDQLTGVRPNPLSIARAVLLIAAVAMIVFDNILRSMLGKVRTRKGVAVVRVSKPGEYL